MSTTPVNKNLLDRAEAAESRVADTQKILADIAIQRDRARASNREWRRRLAAAESRVADLQDRNDHIVGALRLLIACEFDCVTTDEDGDQHYAVPVEHLRPLVDGETTPARTIASSTDHDATAQGPATIPPRRTLTPAEQADFVREKLQ